MPIGIDKLLQLVLGGLGLFDQQRLDEKANKLNIERHEAGLSEIRRMQGDVRGQLQNLVSGTSAGYRQREQDIMAGLKGYGQQEIADIQEQFRQQQESVSSSLARRGLAGTTIGPALQTAIAREQSRATGQAQQRHQDITSRYAAELSGDRLGAEERLGQLVPGFDQSSTAMYLDWLGRREDQPGQSPFLVGQQMLASIFAPEPKEPEGPEWWESAAAFVPSFGFNFGR